MDRLERDNDSLGSIIHYCDRIERAREHFGRDFSTFAESEPYQDSCSLCIVQIGEAVNRLSTEFTQAHPQIEWSKIYGMRCHLVHGYDMFDAEIVWDALENYIPPLKSFCEEHFVE